MKKQTQRPVTISNISGRTDSVSGIFLRPADAKALLLLAHGAGAGMNHPFMNELAVQLRDVGVATLRFQFPYMEDGSKRPDSAKLATATVTAAVQWVLEEAPELPLFVGGKSFGARMSTTAAALGMIKAAKGLVCYGFPLHPAKKPAIDRATHLKDVEVPMLFLQGTRDALADLPLMTKVVHGLPLAKMHVIQGADHSFGVLKSSGRTDVDVIKELARETEIFCRGHS